MKELTKYSRLAGFLEKLYDKLNTDFFDGVLERPVITIQSSSRSYGHYTLYDAFCTLQFSAKVIQFMDISGKPT